MKISLRKANAIQNAINETIKSIPTATVVRINEFQKPALVTESARIEALKNIERKINLTNVLYDIRSNVKVANNTYGIDQKLNKVASLEKNISLVNAYANAEVRLDDAVVAGKLGRLLNVKAEVAYYRDEEVATSVFTALDIADFKERLSTLKKEKQKIQDDLLEANIRFEIELDESSVQLLTKEGIL